MYRVEYLNDNGDWIFHGNYSNEDNADRNAEQKQARGYQTRIIHQGKIVSLSLATES